MAFEASDLYALGKELAPVILGVATYYGSKLIEYLRSPRKPDITGTIGKDSLILSKLIEIRLLADSGRVKLHQFYNGDYYVSGQSTLKCTITHMSLKMGVSQPMGSAATTTGVLVSRINEVMLPMLDKKNFHMVTEQLPDSDWKNMKLVNETLSSHYFRVGSGSNIRGFIEISWQDATSNLNEELIKEISLISDQLNGILSQ
jgi:hypothetical protein